MSKLPWTLTLAEPFEDESLTAVVRVPGVDDEIPLRVERGAWRGVLPGRPTWLRLVTDREGVASSVVTSSAPVAVMTSVDALMGDGTVLPEADAVCVSVTWAKHCHTGGPARPKERFGSPEHMHCADRIGEVEGLSITPDTGLTVGGSKLTFGEIIALAGDFLRAP